MEGKMYKIPSFETFAKDATEAGNKAGAFHEMSQILTGDDIQALKDFVVERPEAVELIKKWIKNPPKWLKTVEKLSGLKLKS